MKHASLPPAGNALLWASCVPRHRSTNRRAPLFGANFRCIDVAPCAASPGIARSPPVLQEPSGKVLVNSPSFFSAPKAKLGLVPASHLQLHNFAPPGSAYIASRQYRTNAILSMGPRLAADLISLFFIPREGNREKRRKRQLH